MGEVVYGVLGEGSHGVLAIRVGMRDKTKAMRHGS